MMVVVEEISSVVDISINSDVLISVVDEPSILYVSQFVEFIVECAIVE